MGKGSRGTQKTSPQKPRRRREIILEGDAWLEFYETVRWCDEQQQGLGDRFEAAVYDAFHRILESPERFRVIAGSIRRTRLNVFDQYSIYFHLESEFIGIVSIFHGARNPAVLRRRLK